MSRQLAPVLVLVAAGLADAAGRHELASYLLLAAVPVIAAVALASYGDLVAGEGGSVGQTALWTIGLVFVTTTAALPSLGSAALAACLTLAGVQVALAASAELKSSK
ncbi:MAG: hypothetical protein H0V79_07470 [Actinobacteria bacterium]|nr:hypothetical protein [Actinomycetota bacterium]